jgi:hypothetical protein
MKASDVFGLVVRVAGFCLVVYGLWCLFFAVKTIPSALFNGGVSLQRSFEWFCFGLPVFAFGIICLLCADWAVKMSYRETSGHSPEVTAVYMKPCDVFGVVIRVLGICLFLYAAWYLLYGIEDALGVARQNAPGEMRFYFAFGIPVALVGVLLVRGASSIVRFSYRTEGALT